VIAYDASGPSPDLLRLQAAEKDILRRYLQFCEAHGLTTFLVAGSALGSLRHGDIIPWDDDIDVGMPRADFKRFIALYAAEPLAGLFLQTPSLEPAYPHSYAKLRMEGTSIVEDAFADTAIRSGIFIDIFPYDALPRAGWMRKLQYAVLFVISLIVMSFSWNAASASRSGLIRMGRRLIFRLRGVFPIAALIRLRERLAEYPRGERSDEMICFEMYGIRFAHRTVMPRHQLLPVSHGKLGELDVPLPADPAAYLAQTFGDYMTPPPEKSRIPLHIHTVDFGDG
jgi:lipopolysaccharide cholinephosphotransferase